jgi:hypothetical protein
VPFVSGLDLGQAQDFTALAVLEQSAGPDPARRGVRSWHYALRWLERYPLGTPYAGPAAGGAGVCECVAAALARPPLPGSQLAVDQTGVGRAVVDLFRARGLPAALHAVTITGGHDVAGPDPLSGRLDWRVPKRDLVDTLQLLLQSGRLRWSRRLGLAAVLAQELSAFRVKVTRSAHEAYGAWRDGQHDDLVLAVALAAWLGERVQPLAAGALGTGGGRAGYDLGRPPAGAFLGGGFGAPPGW